MKRKKAFIPFVFTAALLIFPGCAAETEKQPELNAWQINLLEAEGLPTEYDQLSSTQQHTITRVWEMISYLNEKYEQEFIYVDYIPKDLNQSETLIAYPRSTGYGNGKYAVTVKTKGDTFTDDFHDFSVSEMVETLTNEFLTERFGDAYKYFHSPLACNITAAEVENGNFQWRYGGQNCIFLCEDICSIDDIEKFTVAYAKFLYEHELDGRHRIQILKEFPEDEEIWKNKGDDLFGNKDRLSTGFYILYFNPPPNTIFTDYLKYDQNSEWHLGNEFDILKKYQTEEYFTKYE